MENNFYPTATLTTSELLDKLNNVMDQSRLVREIVNKTEALWSLEQAIGNSREIQIIRKEITRLEGLLRAIRQLTKPEDDFQSIETT